MTSQARSLHLQPQASLSGSSSLGWVNTWLSNRVACHVVFWLFVFVFNAAYISLIGEDREVSLYNLILRVPFILGCCYINLYFLMPRFYYRGKLLLYAASVLAAIFLFNAINLLLLEAFVESPLCPTTFEADATFSGSNYIYKSFYLFSIIGLTSGIKLSKDHYAARENADAIEKEKLQTELSFLKSQIHPHFFFNTLNNLYALIIKKSDLAPDMLLKLSDLMSYGLYDADAAVVPLEKELDHIRNYIELESLRLTDRLGVEFSLHGDPAGKSVPPLIFLPFIENCFKHAASRKAGQQIAITLSIEKEKLTLTTSNPYDEQRKSLDKKGGLGLKNAHRRLQLLFAAGYRVASHTTAGFYEVTVQIPSI
jgi:two-component system, LytTR family, sensor kinase